ncbi:hypothetical protein THAOC_36178 [Thalassiosira oceanica]|uniref:AB hydrolase-1 domain-containing protein n=1 Tax=Thalassiosira oceanica TaxID=159749 RepID=K0R0P0_THAOC|nr:hypothetical protein THAOC_36178 [Thalassiosira oceanica]|mmetsp:Transcript_22005/g.51977  ORF Transcript_22005/g.51977 Transcript_22005/m.51977 type:complete len:390 (+) Transcript_22005:175-1344(+)|eukprot:EJK45215.1 hypothetical protein THAOC_36178 [Thalassiosira oceanica]
MEDNNHVPPRTPEIFLTVHHGAGGRDIHYSSSLLRRDANSGSTELLDPSTVDPGRIGACWVLFYQAGPNRRLLESMLARYAPKFDCPRDTLFLCLNRPGKGGSSSLVGPDGGGYTCGEGTSSSKEKEYIHLASQDVITILDHYDIKRTNLVYMCAGSTFAYHFASSYPERATGHIIGMSSWVLRSIDTSGDKPVVETPEMNSKVHKLAMSGWLPKGFLAYLGSGLTRIMLPVVVNNLPEGWFVDAFRKELSSLENVEFEEVYGDGAQFLDMMRRLYADKPEDSVSVNEEPKGVRKIQCSHDGDALDLAVCMSTQQELGLSYSYETFPTQKEILLFHGECDGMVSIVGAQYLAKTLPNTKLFTEPVGSHQGGMLFYPKEVIDALNRISSK